MQSLERVKNVSSFMSIERWPFFREPYQIVNTMLN